MEAVKLIKAGMGAEAEKRLRKVFENVKDKNADYLNEPAYNVQMALVEILIAQVNYMHHIKLPLLHGTAALNRKEKRKRKKLKVMVELAIFLRQLMRILTKVISIHTKTKNKKGYSNNISPKKKGYL